MKYLFSFLIVVHGLIHLMGFAKAFDLAHIGQLSRDISKTLGIIWLVATILFVTTCIFFLLTKETWWLVALISVLLSQALVILYWQDARFGTIANVIILLIAIPAWAHWRFENHYKKDVVETLQNSNSLTEPLLTLEAISHLPDPVKRYISYCGAINKPVVKNFKIKFEGNIRSDEKSEWMPFTTKQYNFVDQPVRLFFMKATMKGLPVSGYHSFINGVAIMDIRLLSLFTVQYQAGKEMNIAETVTWFNDLCLFAPAALIDKRIQWTVIDSLSSKATFTNKDVSISALLYFNNKGELINFVSDDRFRIVDEDRKVVRFSTPVKNYVEHSGRRYPAYGEAIWNLPEGDLIYGQFNTKEVEYNAKD